MIYIYIYRIPPPRPARATRSHPRLGSRLPRPASPPFNSMNDNISSSSSSNNNYISMLIA